MADSGRSVDIVRIPPSWLALSTDPERKARYVQKIEFRTGHLGVDADSALRGPRRSRLDRQLALLPRVFGELEVALAAASDSGERVTGTARPGLPLTGPAAEVRADLRCAVTSKADLRAEGRTVRLPLRTVPALAATPHLPSRDHREAGLVA